MRAITILVTVVCLAASACGAKSVVKKSQELAAAPKMTVTIYNDPRTTVQQLASAKNLLHRLEADGWFALAPEKPALNVKACNGVHHQGESNCRDALRKQADPSKPASAPNVAFVFTAARNQLANLDCLGVGRYRISGQQSMLADYRLALSEGEKAEAERAKIASCLLSASRELATESTANTVACSPHLLEGEWRAADGLVIRFVGPFNDPFSAIGEGKAVIVRLGQKPSEPGAVLYSKIRRVADCSFLVTRHLWLDLKLHAAPPHIVELKLDRKAGTLSDMYQGGNVFTRLAGPLPTREITE